jgi:hypothetical protein
MSQLRAVPKEKWRGFFEARSKELLGKRAEIEVASLDPGDQIISEWVLMIGITYDSGDDLLDIALDGVNHMIRHPREIGVEYGQTGLSSVAVVDANGARQVVRLKEPLVLPGLRAATTPTAGSPKH